MLEHGESMQPIIRKPHILIRKPHNLQSANHWGLGFEQASILKQLLAPLSHSTLRLHDIVCVGEIF